MTEEHTIMTITCMYCGNSMGTKEGYGVEGDTSGICEDCWAEHFPGIQYPQENEES